MMNDVLPSGAVLSNVSKQDHSNSSGGPGQQQAGSASVVGQTNSNLSLTHGPFTGGPVGGPGGGTRVTSSGCPGGQQSQALDRLNRRVGGYRARQGEILPKYNNTMNTINVRDGGQTQILRQKYIDSTKKPKVM